MFETLDLILPEQSCDGPLQMALDEMLLGAVIKPTLRIYRWSGAWVTFGYFQQLLQVRETYPGMPLVRRWTGGGMVEHGRDLTFSLMIPRGEEAAALPPGSFYRELHHRLASWLSPVFSAKIRLAEGEDLKTGPSCFSAPAGDDLIVSGRKILGGAQRRSAGALLYQGSLQEVERGLLDPMSMASSLSHSVDQAEVGEGLLNGANLLAQRRYRSLEWNSRR